MTDTGLEHLKGMSPSSELLQPLWHAGDRCRSGTSQGNDTTAVDVSTYGQTNAGLEHVKGLTRLWILDLRDTQVTDAGLDHLKGMTQLHQLFLAGTQVTDAGLEHLKGFTQLQEPCRSPRHAGQRQRREETATDVAALPHFPLIPPHLAPCDGLGYSGPVP